MSVVNAVVHDGGGDILAGEAHGPGLFDVEIEFGLAIGLTGVAQVPLVFEVGIGRWLVAGPLLLQLVNGLVAALDASVAVLLLGALDRLLPREYSVLDARVAARAQTWTALVHKMVVHFRAMHLFTQTHIIHIILGWLYIKKDQKS